MCYEIEKHQLVQKVK